MSLKSIDIFLKVVQTGNFNKAAAALKLPNSTVSVRVAELEKSLGVTLLHRTTRKVSVTDEGSSFYKRCVHAMEEIELAKLEAGQSSVEPQGLLRITSAIDIAQGILPILINKYLARYPKMNVEIIATNKRLDLIEENIDVAARIGELEDSTMKAKKLGETKIRLYATPRYLEENGTPKHPKDLTNHDFIGFNAFKGAVIKIRHKDKSYSLKLDSRITADDPQVIKMFLLQHIGFGFSTNFHVSNELEAGELVPILSDWHYRNAALSLVYPGQKFVPKRVKAFLDIAGDEFKNLNYFHDA
jgi:DNA-binding transcriptional LysR family regulator